MKHLLRALIFVVLTGSICACAPEPVEKTVWDDQIQTMDRARAVEDQLMQRADQLARDFEGIDNEDEDPRR